MFTTFGAVFGLTVAIVLIVRKVAPAYALVLGALVGGLVGGGGMSATVEAMIGGTKDMMPSVLRILTSGVLAGALVKTGSAEKIAESIVGRLGARFAVPAVALATMVICATGVFIDIAVITVAPVALAVGRRSGLSVPGMLLAMIGGGKAGNVISPNPNTIATAEAFHLDLTALMAANIVPALCALVVTLLLAGGVARRRAGCDGEGAAATTSARDGEGIAATSHAASNGVAAAPSPSQVACLPPLWAAVAGPLVVVALLALRPLCGVKVDPLVALPAGGLVSVLACGRIRHGIEYAEYGLSKVAGVAILLIGTGTLAGIVKGSGLTADVIACLQTCHLPAWALAPVSGVLMAGATIASQTFSGALTEAGVPTLSAAAMVHAGATVIDSLPHGSFFHATGGAVFLSIKDRLKLIPYEALVGLSTTVVAILLTFR